MRPCHVAKGGRMLKTMRMEGNIGRGYNLSYNCTPSFAAKSSFFYVQSAGHFRCSDDYYTRREGYGSYLLIYTVKGKGYARYRGRQYELKEGQVILMDCYDYQEYFTDKTELWEIKWIHFNGSSSEGYFNTIYENYGPVVTMQDSESVPGHIDSILDLLEKGDMQFEVKSSSMIVQLLTEIMLSASAKSGRYKEKDRNIHVRAAIEFVEKNYHTEISIEDMAAAACASVYHFSRIFKRETGYSPYEFLIKHRINRAKSLLKTTDWPIDDISTKVGFESTSNFIRTFRQLEDMTPLKFRKYWEG